MSSFTDTKEREKTVDFVTYATAGTSFFVKADGGPDHPRRSTTSAATRSPPRRAPPRRTDATAQNKKCTAAGKPGVTRQRLPGPERRQPGAVERPGRRRDGRLARRRLRGEAVGRPVQAHRQPVRHGALRDRDAEGQRPGAAGARRPQGPDGRRHLQADPRLLGSRAERPRSSNPDQINASDRPASRKGGRWQRPPAQRQRQQDRNRPTRSRRFRSAISAAGSRRRSSLLIVASLIRSVVDQRPRSSGASSATTCSTAGSSTASS